MAVINTVAKIAMKPMPRVISPKARAGLDYLSGALFLGSAVWFWKHNKRAALAAIVCGAAELGVALLTDYRGEKKKAIHFGARQEIDLGLAAMTAMMPESLAFKNEPESRFFIAEGAAITAMSQLTQFPKKPEHMAKKSRREKVA